MDMHPGSNKIKGRQDGSSISGDEALDNNFVGVSLRIEIGPRDVSSGSVVISRRDIPAKQGKVFGISMEPSILEAYVKDRLDEIQSSLLQRAISFWDSNIVDVSSCDELKEAISFGKWARGPWSASDADEVRVKEETGVTIRCFPFEQFRVTKTCLMTGNPAEEVAIFGKVDL
ncbi:proline--tRNA ligase, chloroplastic/mitochondrial-like [Hibiscus syriacus]|uniref:proline--tRNA ligase, chloroplastic/mitochondrial-like n=1 Tax=Hibiscus syriacus TaxID=106335 RepID=UPI00192084EC|nr:proline--tRNA ligase, chloroplastic/mitochondrial-like [Hibiscus syriacus]